MQRTLHNGFLYFIIIPVFNVRYDLIMKLSLVLLNVRFIFHFFFQFIQLSKRDMDEIKDDGYGVLEKKKSYSKPQNGYPKC